MLVLALLGYVLLISPSGDPISPAAPAAEPAAESILATSPGLYPAFDWNRRDYVVRCSEAEAAPLAQLSLPPGWQARPDDSDFRPGSFTVELNPGQDAATEISIRRPNGPVGTFHLRCLPKDFPQFEFERYAAGGPRLTFVQVDGNYVALFDRNGAPVWWFKERIPPLNPQILPDGTLAWLVKQPGAERRSSARPGKRSKGEFSYAIRNLDGKVIRYVRGADDAPTDAHELLLLANGNYLLNTFDENTNLDTSPFGGPANARGLGAQIEEVTPNGRLVWRWNTDKHTELDETTDHWWEMLVDRDQPFDYVHFNSAEPVGDSMVLSFRHFDAVYKIDRKTGKVIWKLGGTRTAKSLKVLGDPHGDEPFGGQHDARVDRRGILSVFDNASKLDRPPRVVRYKINEKNGTATLISSFTDPEIPESTCCGSSRQLPNGQWLVNWGGLGEIREPDIDNVVGAYGPDGEPIFRLRTHGKHMYRAQPITGRYPSLEQLRNAMDERQDAGPRAAGNRP